MSAQQVNRVSGIVMIVLSLIALSTILIGYIAPPAVPETDEGTGAHIFQLSIGLLAPLLAVFLVTADWKQPFESLRKLAIPAAAVAIAFAGLFYLEHYYLPAHYR
jgi:Na+-transporting methylmalonyl-CoA/oxaloacetate decarboxylase gamma subunit